ncbi:MAG: EAL domain-containing protein [Chloroflexi bacterium]|nr:MAG: EAL domain-containing protein [Chloroflexota bacterium]
MSFTGFLKRQKPAWYGAVLLIAVALFTLLAIVFISNDEWLKVIILNLSSAIFSTLAATSLFFAARYTGRFSRRFAYPWLILAFAQLIFALGDIFWYLLEVSLLQDPFPSISDVFYLSYYPIFLIGIILLPSIRFSRIDWLKTFLDMTIVMLSAFMVLWSFLLGPLISTGTENTILTQFLTVAYPSGDLVLFWAILVILYRQSGTQPQTPLRLLIYATIIMIITDCIFAYQTLSDTYISGRLIDLGWILASIFTCSAGIVQSLKAHQTSVQIDQNPVEEWPRSSPISRLTYFSYAWVIAAYLLLILNQNYPLPVNFTILVWGVGLLIFMVILRQLLTLNENRLLNKKLQAALEKDRQKTEELSRINGSLQLEIDERRRAEGQLAYDALHDSLTGLPNRVLFIDRLRHAIDYTQRYEQYQFSVLFLDIDHFKVINDSLGHIVGDQLLIAFAKRLRTCLRLSDTVARMGGDEFVILLEDTKNEEDVISAAERIEDHMKLAFILDGRQVYVSASIGIVLFADDYEHPEDIIRDADIAMYRAKTLGKARYEVFNSTLRDVAIARLELENDLRFALDKNEFRLNYQPIISLDSNEILGFEALIRWYHEKRGLISPMDFIPIAEETGLILKIGEWVLREGCCQAREWQNTYKRNPPLTISINISGSQLVQQGFVELVEKILAETGLEGNSLSLEITERICLNSSEEMKSVFKRLHDVGVQFHIDDFGIGYSSLSYLQNFPIDTLKIDKTFVSKIGANSGNSEIVRSIIALAHDLGMSAIAEGVETETQLSQLRTFGCNYGQGYLLSYPIDKQGVDSILQTSFEQAN